VIIIKQIKWVRGEDEKLYIIFVRNGARKRSLGIPRCKLDANIKIGLKEIKCESVDWIQLAQQSTVAGYCKRENEPSGSTKVESVSTR